MSGGNGWLANEGLRTIREEEDGDNGGGGQTNGRPGKQVGRRGRADEPRAEKRARANGRAGGLTGDDHEHDGGDGDDDDGDYDAD